MQSQLNRSIYNPRPSETAVGAYYCLARTKSGGSRIEINPDAPIFIKKKGGMGA